MTQTCQAKIQFILATSSLHCILVAALVLWVLCFSRCMWLGLARTRGSHVLH